MNRIKPKPHQRLLTALCVLLSAHFAIAYNTLTTAMVPFDTYKDMTGAGGAFAYRMLPALLWKATIIVLRPLHEHRPMLHMPNLNSPFSSDEQWFVVLLTFFSMLGTLLVARRLLRTIDGHWGFEWMALGMAYMAYFDTMLVLNRNLYYPYDISGLFLFMLLVHLVYTDQPVLFTLALIPALVNKETAVMTVPLYLGLQYGRCSLGRLIAMGAGWGTMFVAIRLTQRAYIHNVCASCNEMAQNQMADNLHQLRNPLFWVSELSVYGYAYITAILFWRYVPKQVRVTAVTVYVIWLAIMSVAGILREVRIFSELSAVLLLVVGVGIHGWLEARGPRAKLPLRDVAWDAV